MDGTMAGATPLGYQYSGRQNSAWKSKRVPPVVSALGVTGKIQVGAEPGDSAQVIVPAWGVPLAGGTEPSAPEVEVTGPLELALLQAARPMAATTAHTAIVAARRAMLTGFPCDRMAPPPARVPGSSSRACAVCGRVIETALPHDDLRVSGSARDLSPGRRAGANILLAVKHMAPTTPIACRHRS